MLAKRGYSRRSHKKKVFGLGHGELVKKVKVLARERFDLCISELFLEKFNTKTLHMAMQATINGKWHYVFSQWQNEIRPNPPKGETQGSLF